jgi:hypothetical protein
VLTPKDFGRRRRRVTQRVTFEVRRANSIRLEKSMDWKALPVQ